MRLVAAPGNQDPETGQCCRSARGADRVVECSGRAGRSLG